LASKNATTLPGHLSLSRRRFCLCCIAGAASAVTRGWLTPREVFAEARSLVSLIKDSAAVSPIVTLRNNVSVVEGQGGNIAVLTGPDGKVLIDAGVASHFDHASGNEWLHAAGAKIIAQKTPGSIQGNPLCFKSPWL
jgi:hypothetical protein